MTTPQNRRARQRRIRETSPPAASPRPIPRSYSGGGGGDFMILRIVLAEITEVVESKEDFRLYGHYVAYSDETAVEDVTEVVGVEFERVYPPACVQHNVYAWMVRPLLNADTLIALDINATTAELTAALDVEILKSNAYPVWIQTIGGRPTAIPPLWADPNTTFLDETIQMNEGSGI